MSHNKIKQAACVKSRCKHYRPQKGHELIGYCLWYKSYEYAELCMPMCRIAVCLDNLDKMLDVIEEEKSLCQI